MPTNPPRPKSDVDKAIDTAVKALNRQQFFFGWISGQIVLGILILVDRAFT